MSLQIGNFLKIPNFKLNNQSIDWVNIEHDFKVSIKKHEIKNAFKQVNRKREKWTKGKTKTDLYDFSF